jgi:hypothetical protein
MSADQGASTAEDRVAGIDLIDDGVRPIPCIWQTANKDGSAMTGPPLRATDRARLRAWVLVAA